MLGIVLQAGQGCEGPIVHVPLARAHQARDPEFDGLVGRATGPLVQRLQAPVEQDADWLAWRLPGERLIDGLLPELDAHDANGGIRHHLGQPDELEVQCAERSVRVLDGWRHEPSDEVSIVIACPGGEKQQG